MLPRDHELKRDGPQITKDRTFHVLAHEIADPIL